jgi:uncharacterized protein (DUF1015 family)
MADFRPFKGWFYNPDMVKNMQDVICPSFDLLSEAEKEQLNRIPYNSIHLTRFAPNCKPTERRLFDDWKNHHILIQDHKPTFYAYRQSQAGKSQNLGLIGMIRVEQEPQTIVLRHELTFSKNMPSRLRWLNDGQVNVTPTHGLFGQYELEINHLLNKALKQPFIKVRDQHHVLHELAKVNDPEEIRSLQHWLKDQKVFLADGHHRFEAAQIHQKQVAEINKLHTGEEAYNFHLMYLTGAIHGTTPLLPYARLFKMYNKFTWDDFLQKARHWFTLEESAALPNRDEISLKGFGKAYLLKPNALAQKVMSEFLPDHTLPHGVFYLQKLLLDQVLYRLVSPEQLRLEFDYHIENIDQKLNQGEVDLVMLPAPVDIAELVALSKNGILLPQKSTCFLPKVPAGLIVSSMKDHESVEAPHFSF